MSENQYFVRSRLQSKWDDNIYQKWYKKAYYYSPKSTVSFTGLSLQGFCIVLHAESCVLNIWALCYHFLNCLEWKKFTLKSFWLSIIFLTLSPISLFACSTTSWAFVTLSTFLDPSDTKVFTRVDNESRQWFKSVALSISPLSRFDSE